MTTLFAGGGDGGEAVKRASETQRRASEEAKRRQSFAQQRQLAEVRSQDNRTASSRRNPRGRRLFTDDDKQTLS